MENNGFIRRLDNLGRIVIPKEIRDKCKIKADDEMEIFCAESKIYMNKYEKSCNFCGNRKNLKEYKEGCVCDSCLKRINILK